MNLSDFAHKISNGYDRLFELQQAVEDTENILEINFMEIKQYVNDQNFTTVTLNGQNYKDINQDMIDIWIAKIIDNDYEVVVEDDRCYARGEVAGYEFRTLLDSKS